MLLFWDKLMILVYLNHFFNKKQVLIVIFYLFIEKKDRYLFF